MICISALCRDRRRTTRNHVCSAYSLNRDKTSAKCSKICIGACSAAASSCLTTKPDTNAQQPSSLKTRQRIAQIDEQRQRSDDAKTAQGTPLPGGQNSH